MLPQMRLSRILPSIMYSIRYSFDFLKQSSLYYNLYIIQFFILTILILIIIFCIQLLLLNLYFNFNNLCKKENIILGTFNLKC